LFKNSRERAEKYLVFFSPSSGSFSRFYRFTFPLA